MAKRVKWEKMPLGARQNHLCLKAKKMNGHEMRVWNYLKNGILGYRFVWNAPLLGYFPDFLSERLKWVIEIDGSSHIGREEWDENRDWAMQRAGYLVIRYKTTMSSQAIYRDIVKRVTEADEAIKYANSKRARIDAWVTEGELQEEPLTTDGAA